MKKFAFVFFLALLSMSAFAQMASNKPANIKVKRIAIKPVEDTPAKSCVVDFSGDQSKVNVVYGRIEENGDTTLIVMLPEVDINLMNHYYEITETAVNAIAANRNDFPVTAKFIIFNLLVLRYCKCNLSHPHYPRFNKK